MTTFISYLTGAKGKFVAEICDLSIHPEIAHSRKYKDISGGNPYWLTPSVQYYLRENNIPVDQTHGIFPEKNNHQFYIDTILKKLNSSSKCCYWTYNFNLSVDTHYINKSSLEYMLSKEAKVIRIVVSNEQSLNKLANNFFYKNFIDKCHNERVKKLDLTENIVRGIIELGNKRLPELTKDFDNAFLDKPLKEWDKNNLRILFNACTSSLIAGIQEPNIIFHKNLLEVDFEDLSSNITLTHIINFVGGTMNNVVRERIEQYNNAQKQISSFDEYIEEFLNRK